MLEYLRIRGLAIADDVQISFGEGLHVISGETGAGKSILVDALALLRGVRGRSSKVREGSEALQVEAQLRLGPALRAGVARAMEGGEGWSVEDEELIVSRTVQANGRGRCRLQNRLVPQSVLRAVGEQLLDICGQHEQHSLIRGEQHRQILDEFAGLGAEVSAYRDAYETWRTAAKEWRDLRETVGDAARREDYLRFQMDEIDGLALVEGEYEALRAKLTLLRGVARWRALAQEVQQEVYEREGAVVEVLGRLESQAMEGVDASESLGIMAEHLAAARIACEEAAGEAATLLGRLDVEPGALEQAEARVDQIDDLSRKHGCSADELVARAEAMRRELEDVQAVDLRIEEAYQREQETWRQCCGAALGLRKGRQRASTALASRVNRELAAVQMAAARVQVRLISSVEDVELERGAEGRGATARDGLDASGADRIEILFSGNEGETPAPVSKVASGGELSRLLLAFKTVLAGGSAVETSVFDEVDAGVSGAAAEAVGVRLYRASVGRQVICVTHLPQIAALADHHVRIEKVVEGGRTVSRVRRLSRGERVEELARMLGGSEVTKSARAHARALLEEAARRREEPGEPWEDEGDEDVHELAGSISPKKRRAAARGPAAAGKKGARRRSKAGTRAGKGSKGTKGRRGAAEVPVMA